MEKLFIIIPAYNEEETITEVAEDWHGIASRFGEESRLVIIDDGSKDSTYQKLRELQTRLPRLVVLTKPNEGHGATLLYGYHYALEEKADYIFQTDSDGQTLSVEFSAFWDKRHKADAVIGDRRNREDGISRVVVTKVLKLVLRMIFGVDVTDANAPFRLMRRELLEKYISLVPERFNLSNVMLTVLFLSNKERVEFVPVTFRPRQGGMNSINIRKIVGIGIQAVKDFRKISKTMETGAGGGV